MARASNESDLGFHLTHNGRPISIRDAKKLMADAIENIVIEDKKRRGEYDEDSFEPLFGKNGNPAYSASERKLFLEDSNYMHIDGIYRRARALAGIVVVRDGAEAEVNNDPKPTGRELGNEDPSGDEDPTVGGRRRKSQRRKRSSRTKKLSSRKQRKQRKSRKSSKRRKH